MLSTSQAMVPSGKSDLQIDSGLSGPAEKSLLLLVSLIAHQWMTFRSAVCSREASCFLQVMGEQDYNALIYDMATFLVEPSVRPPSVL